MYKKDFCKRAFSYRDASWLRSRRTLMEKLLGAENVLLTHSSLLNYVDLNQISS